MEERVGMLLYPRNAMYVDCDAETRCKKFVNIVDGLCGAVPSVINPFVRSIDPGPNIPVSRSHRRQQQKLNEIEIHPRREK